MEIVSKPTRWNLDKLHFGLNYDEAEQYFYQIEENLKDVDSVLNTRIDESKLNALTDIIQQIESLESFYYCLYAEGAAPNFLSMFNGRIASFKRAVHSIRSKVQDTLCQMSEEELENWINSIHNKSFVHELWDTRKSSEEKIAPHLANDTLRSLEEIYTQLVKKMNVKVNHNGAESELPFTEASYQAMFHTEASVRDMMFKACNLTLRDEADVFATIYNQMVATRLHEDRVKGLDCLEASIKINGLSKTTLLTMWDAVDSYLPELSRYLDTNKNKLSWHELMTSSQEINQKIPFSEAVEGLNNSLVAMDHEMPLFIHHALENEWVDAEWREGKPSGGFCAPFMTEGESRISLNYDESFDSARRLAHELGHAWHFKQMSNPPTLLFSNETFEMTMAETSSIFFESVYIDYLIETTANPSDKKAILGWEIERSLNYLMSIRAAFVFEKEVYILREKGPLRADQLEELSLKCQEKAYGAGLSEYEPYMWMKYGQFYQADIPFYNYPYSFGFLLSIGLLEMAKADESFQLKFKGFLRDTGRLPLEQLVRKHFEIDLSEPTFWQLALERIVEDIEVWVGLRGY